MTPAVGRAGRRTTPERVAVSLSRGERDALRTLAAERGEPEATTAARLIRAALADNGARLDAPPRRRRGPGQHPQPTAQDSRPGPPWLPTSARGGAIVALRERYAHDLRAVPDDLRGDPLLAERLAALSVWRDQLDAGVHADPRMELAFSAELISLGRWLEERGRRQRATRSPL